MKSSGSALYMGIRQSLCLLGKDTSLATWHLMSAGQLSDFDFILLHCLPNSQGEDLTSVSLKIPTPLGESCHKSLPTGIKNSFPIVAILLVFYYCITRYHEFRRLKWHSLSGISVSTEVQHSMVGFSAPDLKIWNLQWESQYTGERNKRQHKQLIKHSVLTDRKN